MENHPLLEAARDGNFEEIERRIKAGESPDTRGAWSGFKFSKHTPLIVASCNGHTKIVEFLIFQGATIDLQDTLGRTALHFACVNGYTHIVKILLTKGAHTDIKNNVGKTALDLAKEKNQKECVDLITQHVKRVPEGAPQIQYARQQAAERQLQRQAAAARQRVVATLNVAEVKDLINKAKASQPVLAYCAYGHTDNTIPLPPLTLIHDKKNDSCLHIAALFHNCAFFLYLLRLLPDLDSKSWNGQPNDLLARNQSVSDYAAHAPDGGVFVRSVSEEMKRTGRPPVRKKKKKNRIMCGCC
eukprot:TRINITY_DN1838_c0_g2_i6.p1 TRINITY_DN1838_c0_g2~~TRINITY_DN1838_c0_g2_i6.p1  ORF type:complete len:300 (-),score=63.12 TRINITY_DN1838_c0_g2_i6:475-1374(-)